MTVHFRRVLRRILVRVPQLSVKARLAHSARLAAIALLEVMTTGRTIKIRDGHCVPIGDGGHLGSTVGTLLTDDLATPDTDSGHRPPRHISAANSARRTDTQLEQHITNPPLLAAGIKSLSKQKTSVCSKLNTSVNHVPIGIANDDGD
jgi:hypothetical protein